MHIKTKRKGDRMDFDYRIIRSNGEVVPDLNVRESGAVVEIYSLIDIKRVSCHVIICDMELDIPLEFVRDCKGYYIVTILPLLVTRRQEIVLKITDCKNRIHKIHINVR